jgi:hypothetical protein
MLALEYGRDKSTTLHGSLNRRSVFKNAQPTLDPLQTDTASAQDSCTCGGGCPRCAPVQGKLNVGSPGDRYEQEADRIAKNVLGAPDPGDRHFQPQASRVGVLQAEGTKGIDHPEIASQAQNHVTQCPGRSLSKATRDFFEPRLGRNFSGVKVHTCKDASLMCGALQARAFTLGANIFFQRSAYDPASSTGKMLLAHELTHVAQQSSNPEPRIQRWPQIPGIGLADVCIIIHGRKVCGSDAKAACEKAPWLPGCKYVCKMLGCKTPQKEDYSCPIGFHPGRTTEHKGECCVGDIESEWNCCPEVRASWMERRCCAKDEFVNKQGRCEKFTMPIVCPEFWKTTSGLCCIPPRVPRGRFCVLPVTPQPPTPKPPVTPPVPAPKEIFFEFDRPHVAETNAAALEPSTTKTGYANFKTLVTQMKSDSTLRVQLVGKASPDGPAAYNMRLSARRAELVKTALMDKGIAASRIIDPPLNALDPGCKKVDQGVISCGEVGASSKSDRQVSARLFRRK